MKYRLEAFICKIEGAVTAVIDGNETEFHSGLDLYKAEFDRPYLVDGIYAKENRIYVRIKENDGINNLNWAEDFKETISFFREQLKQ